MRASLFGILSGSGTPMGNAIQFTAANVGHVNHGQLWQASTIYKEFWADFLMKPQGSGYLLSAGYGGNHDLLFGTGALANGGYTITGNIADSGGPTSTSFGTYDILRDNEWAYVSVGYDGANLVVSINGVPSSLVAYTGNRETTATTDGVAFVGGSDHQNWTGRCAGWRLMESNPSVFYGGGQGLTFTAIRPPVHSFSNASYLGSGGQVSFNLVADYRTGTLLDLSPGLSGMVHNGFLAEAYSSITGVQGALNDPLAYCRDATKFPTWVNDLFAWPTTSAAQKTQIAGTRVYDDFSRPDVHYGNSVTLDLGSTRIGGEAWGGSLCGILNGQVFATAAGPTVVIDAGTTDKTLIWRRPVASMPAGVAAVYRYIFRYVDANNYEYLYVDEYGSGYIFEVVAGSGTNIGSMSFGTGWTEAKVTVAGSACTVYANGVSVATPTLTENLTGTGAGIDFNSPMLRLSEFGIS